MVHSPIIPGAAAKLLDRMEPDLNGGCWLWSGALTDKGYGQTWWEGRQLPAHRLSYLAFKGEIGAALVCHRCDIRSCINPGHLFLGSNDENMADMVRKGRQNKWSGRRSGEGNYNAKLTEDDVRYIRTRPGSGAALAAQYGVTRIAIYEIWHRKTWKHVDQIGGAQ